MAYTAMDELNLDLIEEGEFKDSANEELTSLQRALLRHVKKYGPERTNKAKAKLVITIELTRSKLDPNAVEVATRFDRKMPGRPTHTTIAIAAEAKDGEMTLFVRRTGSTAEPPEQMRLSTNDGRGVDPETKEAIPHDQAKGPRRAPRAD